MQRYLVLTVSVLIGSVVAVGFFVLSLKLRPFAPQGGPPAREEIELLLFEACVVFYAVIYFTGQSLYRILGDQANEQAVENTSRFHMAVLHFLAGSGLVALGIKTLAERRWILTDLVSGGLGLVLLLWSLPILLRHRAANRKKAAALPIRSEPRGEQVFYQKE